MFGVSSAAGVLVVYVVAPFRAERWLLAFPFRWVSLPSDWRLAGLSDWLAFPNGLSVRLAFAPPIDLLVRLACFPALPCLAFPNLGLLCLSGPSLALLFLALLT